MTNPERVYRFLKQHQSEGYCDDCLENQTGVSRNEINSIADTLALFANEFKRKRAVCPQRCSNRDKLVTFSM